MKRNRFLRIIILMSVRAELVFVSSSGVENWFREEPVYVSTPLDMTDSAQNDRLRSS